LQHFAIASVSPRSIAWLIRLDEWDRFEKIVKYNCAMQGGYFNVIIPLTDQNTISEVYQQFLVDYDPDIIILAPGMTSDQLDIFSFRLHPFCVIPWESISRIAALDPLEGRTGINTTMVTEWTRMLTETKQLAFVAVADNTCPDTSKLALVACGETEPREPLWHKIDDEVIFDATGYREHFLERLLTSKYIRSNAGTYIQEDNGIIPAPNRYQLADLISEEYKFPLYDAVKILKCCCNMQHFPWLYQSFIGLTSSYHQSDGTPQRTGGKRYPALVILVSEAFKMEEAILFRNLRANAVYVAWLSFLELERHLEEIVSWLESDELGILLLAKTSLDIVFSSSRKEVTRLQVIVDLLESKKQRNFINCYIELHTNLVSYDYMRPYIRQERVFVAKDGSRCTFIPKLPLEKTSTGVYAVTLEWSGLMLPQSSDLIHTWISSKTEEYLSWGDRRKAALETIIIPKFRIAKNRYLRSLISTETPLEFNRPSSEQVVEILFITAGFSYIEPSSTAKYHKNFVVRAGDLETAAHYLSTSPYRELLEVLSDNKQRGKTGWILTNPSPRRVLHHFQLRELLRKATPTETKMYFDTVADELPEEAISLLEEGILERGFLLKCNSCSFNSWYPAEHVGQVFECSRCFHSQVYKSNPLWLYKLREVIFQGFEDDMQVPLLALNYLKRRSQHHFEWIPDSDVYWSENNEEMHQNVDILCICDGKLYIGEAKSNDEIDEKQFSFYEKICKLVTLDGIVFATSKPRWGRGVLQRIERLKSWFEGEVFVLTATELYPNILDNPRA
jgi:hypothetical protein